MSERERAITVIDQRRNRLIDIEAHSVLVGIGRNRVTADRIGHRGERFERCSVDRRNRSTLGSERERAIAVINQRRDRLGEVEAHRVLIGVRANQVAGGERVRDRRERLKCGYVECRGDPSFVRIRECLIVIIDQRRDGLIDVPNHSILIGIGRNGVARNELSYRR